ncbi:MAG: PEP-utilizing enzyme, partial [Chloroflexota bacterium]
VAGRSIYLQRRLLGTANFGGHPSAEVEMLKRLQRLIGAVRNLFGDEEWDIEWADDGSTCWLLQIRPITTPPRRNEAFTYANIREIMPDPPSLFMSTIVARSSADLFAYYRQFDSSLPEKRPMIEMFAMRPLFNISLLVDMMRWWGLPSSLVTNSIGGQADQESRLNFSRFLLKAPVLLKQGWAQLTAVGSSQRATEEIMTLAKESGPTLTENALALQKLFVALVTEMFNLTAALSGPLLILRLTDTLSAHNRRNRTITTEMYTDLEPLRHMVAAEPDLLKALRQGDVPAHYGFQIVWQAWLDKHGRRGVYESDIARPRYHEDPSGILKSLGRRMPQTGEAPSRSLLEWLTLPVWWQCQRVLSAREWWRYHSMDAYDILRQKIIDRGEHFVSTGQLSSISRLWDLTPAEWETLEKGQHLDAAFWETRQAKIKDAASYDFPDLIYRMDDLESFRPDAQGAQGDQPQRLSGVSLTDGNIQGKAWVLREPETSLPNDFDPDHTILIARSVDAGWIPTFSLVSGVAVEIGGDLSHGSIILREIGLPAITNVQHLTRGIQTGDHISLRAGSGIVEIIERDPA